MQALRVLFVEDNEDDMLLVVRELQNSGYRVESTRVDTAEALRRSLRTGEWDVIISDYSLPGFDAPAALRVLHDSGVDLPFIIISGTVGEDVAVTSLKAGAHDYIPKHSLKRLVPAVQRALQDAQVRSQRRRAEEQLRESIHTLETLFAASPLAIVVLDTKGRVIRWNATAERIFGWRADEVLNRPFPGLEKEGAENFRERLARVLKGASIANEEATRKTKDGTDVRVAISAAPLRDGQGKIVGAMGMIADITERQELERQFQQAQKLEAIGRLAGGIAHDFNNVLTAIRGYGQLLLSDIQTSSVRAEDMQEILNAVDRAATLTRQLLAFSRKQVLQAHVIDLNDVVQGLQRMLERLIGEDVKLRTEMSSKPAVIYADRGQIEQILMNLVVNARDAMPRGGIIDITTTVEKEAGIAPPQVVLKVSDNGEGMTAEVLSHLFEPFFTTKEAGKGTGLGLSTVYGLVQQNHGTIEVASSPGQGATFTMAFPYREERPAPVHASNGQPEVPRAAYRILVLEDEAAIRRLVRRTLERSGHQVLEAASGREALEQLKQADTELDLLLTDVVLPDMPGPRCAEQSKQLRPGLRVVYMSGYSHELLNFDEATTYLEKPFTTEELLNKIHEAMREHAA